MKRKYVVRLVLQNALPQDAKTLASPFIECLRYAGLLEVHRDEDDHVTLDLLPPKGVDSEVWATMNANRMRTFGYNAVMTPAWKCRAGFAD